MQLLKLQNLSLQALIKVQGGTYSASAKKRDMAAWLCQWLAHHPARQLRLPTGPARAQRLDIAADCDMPNVHRAEPHHDTGHGRPSQAGARTHAQDARIDAHAQPGNPSTPRSMDEANQLGTSPQPRRPACHPDPRRPTPASAPTGETCTSQSEDRGAMPPAIAKLTSLLARVGRTLQSTIALSSALQAGHLAAADAAQLGSEAAAVLGHVQSAAAGIATA